MTLYEGSLVNIGIKNNKILVFICKKCGVVFCWIYKINIDAPVKPSLTDRRHSTRRFNPNNVVLNPNPISLLKVVPDVSVDSTVEAIFR